MKDCRHLFSNYPAFETHFEACNITRINNVYYVYYENVNEWIQCGSKEYINGWLYGCVQTVCGQAKKKEDK
jgi:hypothetical protein